MRSRKHDGDDMESTSTSSSPKWIEAEKLARFGTVHSAERRKPKRAKLQAAQNIQWSGRLKVGHAMRSKTTKAKARH